MNNKINHKKQKKKSSGSCEAPNCNTEAAPPKPNVNGLVNGTSDKNTASKKKKKIVNHSNEASPKVDEQIIRHGIEAISIGDICPKSSSNGPTNHNDTSQMQAGVPASSSKSTGTKKKKNKSKSKEVMNENRESLQTVKSEVNSILSSTHSDILRPKEETLANTEDFMSDLKKFVLDRELCDKVDPVETEVAREVQEPAPEGAKAEEPAKNIPPVEYVQYLDELQMPLIMKLIQKDLSEPYSIYTYRYFIHNWPKLCFLVSVILVPI